MLSGFRFKLLWWLPTAAYMVLIFYLSSKTGDEVSIPTPDYVAHGLEYLVLSVLAGISLRKTTCLSWKNVFAISVIIASVYGITDEWHQSFVPGRHATAADWLADTAGAVAGQAILSLIKHKF